MKKVNEIFFSIQGEGTLLVRQLFLFASLDVT